MTKRTNNSTKNSNSNRGGRMTKVDGEAASVAGDSTEATAETETAELSTEDATTAGGESPLVPAEAPEPEVTDPVETEQPATEDAPAEGEQDLLVAIVDPFADLPVVKVEDYEYRDLTDVELVSAPRKYESVHTEARAAKLPVKKNWKHAGDMIAMGRVQKEFKPTSVYGTIAQVVASYGRAGVPAYVLVAKVRQAQIGNKRSHYCTALPPIGWAEGWIDTFISKNHGRVMEKKAPPLTVETLTEIVEGDKAAEQQAEAISAAA